jgi:hypothetical protein
VRSDRAPREAGEAAAILVFNPLGWTRSDRWKWTWNWAMRRAVHLVDRRGVKVPMERRGLGSRQLIHTFDRGLSFIAR